jgi:hypothetical protein
MRVGDVADIYGLGRFTFGSNGTFLSVTSAYIQCPSSRVSPRKGIPNNFRIIPAWTLEVNDMEVIWPEPTFGTICSNQVADSHIFPNFLSVHRLYKMRDDVIIVLIESFQLCREFDAASVLLDMLAENTLGTILAEKNRVELLRRYECLIVQDIGKLTIGKAGVGSVGKNMSAVPRTSESPVPIAHNLRVGTGMPNESNSGRRPNIR